MDKITYLLYYPHYMGTISQQVKFNLDEFLLVAAAFKGEPEDEDYEYIDGLEERALNNPMNRPIYALTDIFYENFTDPCGSNYRKLIKALATKGFWVHEWEEGTQAVALPGYEKDALAGMAKIEMQFREEEFSEEW
jgi:hypothetical protein